MRDALVRYDCPWCGRMGAEVHTRNVALVLFQDGQTDPRVLVDCHCGIQLAVEIHSESIMEDLMFRVRKDRQIIDTRNILDWGFDFLDGLEDHNKLAGLLLDEVRV